MMRSLAAPRWVRLLLAGSLVLLAVNVAHDGLGIPWPPILPQAWPWSYFGAQLGATAVCLARVVLHRDERGPWLLIALGLLSFSVGDLYYSIAIADLDPVPFPTLADGLYLALYPATFAGLVLLVRRRASRAPAGLWLDGLIEALAIAALGAALIFKAVVADTHGAPLTVGTNLSYPLGDVALLGVIAWGAALGGRGNARTWILLAGGLLLFAVVDSVYLYQTALGTYREDTILDPGWPASFALVALAAWQPGERLRGGERDGRPGLVAPTACALISLVLLLYDHFVALNPVALVLATACALLVIARLALTFVENARVLRQIQREALTDPLTTLHNRRALLADLEQLDEGDERLLALFDLNGFKRYNDSFGHAAGDALLARLGRRLVDAVRGEGRAYRMGGDEFCLLVDAGMREAADVVLRAADALSERGGLFEITPAWGTATIGREAPDPPEALRLADRRMYAHKQGGARRRRDESRDVLVRAIHERNRALGDHLGVVAELAEAVAHGLGLEAHAVREIRQAAELHDVGKVAIPDTVLNKPGPLDAGEWELMHRHPVIGERILAAAPSLTAAARLVRASHERVDGTGYPDGREGEQIPVGSRIIAVCDAYDAMTSHRCYRSPMSQEQAIRELRRCAGAQFDPVVVDAMCAVLARRALTLAA